MNLRQKNLLVSLKNTISAITKQSEQENLKKTPAQFPGFFKAPRSYKISIPLLKSDTPEQSIKK